MDLLNSTFEKIDSASPQLKEGEIQKYLSEINEWQVVVESGIHKLSCSFWTQKYNRSLTLTNRIASLAESVNHHPIITLAYSSVNVVWWTHEIQGLHKNDFIMAAMTSRLFEDFAG